MNPKTTMPMILCGLLLAVACKNDQHTLPPTESAPGEPGEPGERVIDDELAPPDEPSEMRTIPQGEAVEEYREEMDEDID
jgi:hypothetical protein